MFRHVEAGWVIYQPILSHLQIHSLWVQPCSLTGFDMSQQKLSLSMTLMRQLVHHEKNIFLERSGEESHST